MWAISLRAGPRIPCRLIDIIHTTLSCDVWRGKNIQYQRHSFNELQSNNYKQTNKNKTPVLLGIFSWIKLINIHTSLKGTETTCLVHVITQWENDTNVQLDKKLSQFLKSTTTLPHFHQPAINPYDKSPE